MSKTCSLCGVEKPLEHYRPKRNQCRACIGLRAKEWRTNNRKKYRGYLDRNKEKISENIKRYRKNHPEKVLDWARAHRKRAKSLVLSHYGSQCACCGFSEALALTIDHIGGDGSAHRKKIGHGATFYKWLIRNNYPEGYQVLCWNCNWVKGKKDKCLLKHD